MLIQEAKAAIEVEAAYEWLIKKSVLSIYVIDDMPKKNSHDVLLKVGEVYIHIFHDDRVFVSHSDELPSYAINNHAIKSAKHLVDRQLLSQKMLNTQMKKSANHLFIGLSSLKVSYNKKIFSIDHQFGSQFLKQLTSICYQDVEIKIHLFGMFGFVAALDKLVTPTNLVNFLSYHRKIVKKNIYYDFESQLANKYITSPVSYLPAVSIEKHLIKNKLIASADASLYDFFRSDGYELQALERMYAQSKPWKHFVSDNYKRHQNIQSDNQEYQVNNKNVMRTLLRECLYSRMKIMYVFNSLLGSYLQEQDSRPTGVFSYSNLGCYYLLVMYASNKDDINSKQSIEKNIQARIKNVYLSFPKGSISSVYILGFSLRHSNNTGELSIEMDVYNETTN